MTKQPKIKLLSDEEIKKLFIKEVGSHERYYVPQEVMYAAEMTRDECERRASPIMKKIARWFYGHNTYVTRFDDLWQQYSKEQEDDGE